ncbi:hypothetical protein ACWEN6_23915 [Sphaerisporangium sp. NPDC004334]
MKAAIVDVLADNNGKAMELGELLRAVLQRRVVAAPSEIYAMLKRLLKDGRVWSAQQHGTDMYFLPEDVKGL